MSNTLVSFAQGKKKMRVRFSRGQWMTLILVGVGLIGMLLWVYRDIVFGPWNYSYTNCLYRWAPFTSEHTSTAGYCYSDINDNVLPLAFTTIHQGVFTTWVPQFSIGAPMGVNLYFSPLNYLYMLPFGVAMPLIALTKVIGSFLGMFLFVRQIGYTARGAYIAGVTYALSAAMVTWQGWPHTEVGMWAPWLFLVIDKLIKQLRIRYVLIIAFVVFVMLMAGMPTFAVYFFYLAFAYALVFVLKRYWGQWRKAIVATIVGIGAVLLGVVMSLPYTGDLLTSVGSNGYAASRADWSSVGLQLPQLKTLLFPFLATTTKWSTIESQLYTGTLAVITLAFVIINFRHKPKIGFFTISAVILLMLLFTPVLNVLFTHLPVVSTSYKFRIVILLNFSLAVLLGINMDDLLTRVLRTTQEYLAVWGAAALGVIGFVVMLWWTRNAHIEEPGIGDNQVMVSCVTVITFVCVVIGRSIFSWTASRSVEVPHHISAEQSSGTKTLWGTITQVGSTVCTVVLCAVIVADTGYFAAQFLPLISKGASAIPTATSTIRYLQEHTTNGEKIISKNVDLPVDSPMFYGLRDIRGHGLSMTNPDIKAYYEAIDSSVYDSSPTNTVFNNASNENMLRYIGVKYIVSSERMETIEGGKYSSGEGMKAVGDDGLLVKELDRVAPNVQLVDNATTFKTNNEVLNAMSKEYTPNMVYFSTEYGAPEHVNPVSHNVADATTETDTTEGIVNVMEQKNGAMSIGTNADSDKFLVVNEYADSDWHAYIDGQEVPLYKGNGLFRTVQVPRGKHTVELKYEPNDLKVMFAIAGVGAVVLLFMAVFAKRENRWLDKISETSASSA